MKEISESKVIDYVKNRDRWVNDNDLNIHFIPEQSEIYFQLRNLIKSLIAQGKLQETSGGYKIPD